ncbi:MAG: DUF2779 domain-containing protein [Chloroflexi bacterium]|nr:DUF2779 domain-containing protein [Chloroflexota bacterium]
MPKTTDPTLSKTRFTSGLQCLKLLHLGTYSRELADPVPASQQALFDSGTHVGVLARQRFPDGLLIDAPYNAHSRAVTSTSKALSDAFIPAIYEAGFDFENIRIRVDILSRNSDHTFNLIEVKSSTSVKPEHIPDAAIQLHVLEGSGVPIGKTFLMHIDNTYVYQGGDYDLDKLFRLEDITDQARSYLQSVPGSLAAMWEALHLDETPPIEIGPQCTRPYRCAFYNYCHKSLPEHHIEQLPRAKPEFIDKLRAAGIQDIGDIPPDFPGLSANQQRVRNAVATGRPYVGPELADALSQATYPLHFLDFETFNAALPAYVGTRPYQVIPFQWSLHVQDSSGALSNISFLHDGSDDPREAFTRSLLDAIGPQGTILVYSSYEQTIIWQLADLFPQYQERLSALPGRFLDLLALVRAHFYHPNFHGSYSIKAVLPALDPDLTYSDLDIQDGSLASIYFAKMIAPDTQAHERERLRNALIRYCERDTLAMVHVLAALQSMSQTTTPQS